MAPPSTGEFALLGRWAGFLIFMALAFLGLRGGTGLWVRETSVATAASMIHTPADTPAAARILARTGQEFPACAMAHYVLGSLIIRGEQRRILDQNSVKGVNLDLLDNAKEHLLVSVRSSLYPYNPLLILGQGLLLGARLAKDEKNFAQVRPFATEAMSILIRALKLNPNPAGNPADLWIEAADAAAMAGRADLSLFALSRADSYRASEVTPAQRARIPRIALEAGYALADTPLLTSVLQNLHRSQPENPEIWKQIAAVGRIDGGKVPSLLLLREIAARHPDNPLPRVLIEAVEKSAKGL